MLFEYPKYFLGAWASFENLVSKLNEVDCVSRVHFCGYYFVNRHKVTRGLKENSKGASILKRLHNTNKEFKVTLMVRTRQIYKTALQIH